MQNDCRAELTSWEFTLPERALVITESAHSYHQLRQEVALHSQRAGSWWWLLGWDIRQHSSGFG